MKRHYKQSWQIVAPTVRAKVARGWEERAATVAYLQELYEQTLRRQQELQHAAKRVPGSAQWARNRTAADVDLARVYAVAAHCVECETYPEFAAALNRLTVGHLARLVPGEPPWAAAALRRARKVVLSQL